jgi:WD40 repeat protein
VRSPSRDASCFRFVDPTSYNVKGEIAQGGIGRILCARDERLDRPVALKELLEPGSSAEERFVREALVTARLQHPAIVPIYEAGRWPSGAPFYAMKLVSGRSFAEVIDETRTLDQRLALLPHVLSVTEAIAYAHSERILHRDLKPENIIIGTFGETVVIDWGLAKDLRGGAAGEPSVRPRALDDVREGSPSRENITMAGAIMGTPAYMPPEQAAGQPVDERADVYALGAILYHLLAGALPYDGTSALGILRKVLAGPPAPLSSKQKGVPRDLITIVDKAMAPDPAARYPTAKELAEDLRRFQTGQIVRAHDYSRRERLARFARRYRAPLAVAAFALLVLAAVGAASFRRIIQERRVAQQERDRAEEQRDLAAHKQAEAESAQRQAAERADALTLFEASAAAPRDPNEAIAWLKSLSPSFNRWDEARLIAAEAQSHWISTVLRGHTGSVNHLAFSPDSRSIATFSDDRSVRLWDINGKLLRTLAGHEDEVWRGAFSPDGRRLVSGSKDGTLRLWELETGATRVLRGHTSGILAAHFSPDGQHIVSKGAVDSVRLWDVETSESRVLPGGPSQNWPAVFSPNGKLVAYGRDRKLVVWNIAEATSRTFPIETTGVESMGESIAVSPDGSLVALGGSDGKVWLIDARTGAPRRLHVHAGAITQVVFSPAGGTVVSASKDGLIGVFELQTGTDMVLRGHDGQVYGVAVSPDGRQIASAGSDRTVRLWDPVTGRNRMIGGFRDIVVSLRYSPDGKRLAATSFDQTARIWNLEQTRDRALARHEKKATRAIFSPDGRLVASAGEDGAVLVTNLSSPGETSVVIRHDGPVRSIGFSSDSATLISAGDDGRIRVSSIRDRRSLVREEHEGPIQEIALSPDGSHFASGGADGAVRLSTIAGEETRILVQHEGEVKCIAFAPDGKRLASGGADGTVRIADITGGEGRILGKQKGPIGALAFSPDGRFLGSGSKDHTLRIWDAPRLEPIHSIDASGDGITRIVFASDGKTFASAGSEPTIRVWEPESGKSRAILRGHNAMVFGLAMSPDGARIASSDRRGGVRVWDLRSGKSRALEGYPAPVGWIAFSRDGKMIVSAGDDGMVRLWNDDLPDDPAGLRAWLDAATSDSLAEYGHALPTAQP